MSRALIPTSCAVVTVGFGSSEVTVREDDGQFMMCVVLDVVSAVPFSVTIEDQEGSATRNGEFVLVCYV